MLRSIVVLSTGVVTKRVLRRRPTGDEERMAEENV
jgi:hypothetical protein